jgi:hypothetical protein
VTIASLGDAAYFGDLAVGGAFTSYASAACSSNNGGVQ